MKKIIYSLLFATILSGCYEDKGNYEYTLDSMNEITTVSFTPAVMETAKGRVIEVQQALSTEDTYRRIDVALEQTLLNNFDELEFNWFRTYISEGKNIKDTIHSKGFLEFTLPVGESMEYDIFLQIYDKTTTLSHYSQFKITTRPIFKNSLFVLHGNEGERKLGNIEVIGNETKVRSDITPFNPENRYHDAVGFTYTTYWDLSYGDSGRGGPANTLTIFNKGGGTKAYDPYGMDVKFSTDLVLRPENDDFVLKKMILTGDGSNETLFRIALSENGDVYVSNNVYALYKPGYSYEIEGNDNEHQSDYMITAATITDKRFLFWDAKYNRFLYSAKQVTGFPRDENSSIDQFLTSTNKMFDAKVDFTTLENSPEGMTAVLGYINYRESYDTQNAYFIFKDESTEEFYRYKLSSDSKDSGGAGENSDAEYTILEEEKLEGFNPDCDLSTVTYNSWFTTNFLFYSDGRTIYRYSVLSGDNIPVYIAPDGYNITMMKFRTDDRANHTHDLGRILSIGLYNGTNGAIAEIKFNTAADIDEDFEPLFYDKDDEGKLWGIIKDLQFANEIGIDDTTSQQ